MIERRHLARAPIREALIDLRINPNNEFSVDRVKSIAKEIIGEYPESHHMYSQRFDFRVDEGEELARTSEKQLVGIRCLSDDKYHVVQFRKDGFTFSRLEPYEDWEAMRDEAAKLWNLYREAVVPASISRVAVRYINNLKIPLPLDDFSDYFTAAPTIPDGLPQGVSSFLSRMVLHEPKIDATCIYTQSLEGSDEKHAHFLLDIDVFEDCDFDPEKDFFWKKLEEFREFKNKVFFESITERCAELFI